MEKTLQRFAIASSVAFALGACGVNDNQPRTAAQGEGKYKGRAPTALAKAAEARALRAEGVGATEIAKRLKMGRASVYRVLSPSP